MTIDIEHLRLMHGVDLSLLDDIACDVCPLPLEAFGFWGRWISGAAADAGCPEDYVAVSLLTGAAAVIGNGRWVAAGRDGWFKEPCVLWSALVGPPSHGKTPATTAIVTALKEIDRDELVAFEPERLKREEQAVIARATEAAWKDAVAAAVRAGEPPPPMPPAAIVPTPAVPPQILVGDATGEGLLQIAASSPRGLLWFRDELSGLLGGLDRYRGGGSERGMLLEGYGGQEFRISRKAGGNVIIPNLALNVLGGLQPDRFQSLIAKSDDDGLQGRFLFVFPVRRPFEGRPTKRTDYGRLMHAFRRLRGLEMRDDGDGPKPVIVTLDDVASDSFVGWMKERGASAPVGTGRFQAWHGKGPGRVLRLALILTLLDWAFDGVGHPSCEIRDEALVRAVFLHDEYFASHARRTFQDAALPEPERHARTIARWLASEPDGKQPKAVTLRGIYREKHLGVTGRDAAHAAAQILVDAGWLRPAPSRAGEHPGRKSERFDIPDGLWTALAELHDDRA
jgi:hypothetical protein